MRIHYLGFLVGLVFISCVKNPGSLLGGQNNSNIVIEGGLNGLGYLQAIRISQVSTSTLTNPLPVSKLLIRVTGGGEIMNFQESSVPGIYTVSLNHKLTVNQRYVFSAISEDNTQQIFALDTLIKVVPIKGSSIPFTTSLLSTGKVEIQIPKHVFGQKNCLKWLILPKSGSLWASDQFSQKYPFTYVHQLGAPNALYSLTTINTIQDFNATDSVIVYKFSVSNTHGQYLYGIFEETEWKGLFSGAPSQVVGNISLGGQGFFSAMDVDSRTYKVKDLIGKKVFF